MSAGDRLWRGAEGESRRAAWGRVASRGGLPKEGREEGGVFVSARVCRPPSLDAEAA